MSATLPFLTDGSAPEWSVHRWWNTEDRPTLASLQGRVVALEAFQMLCPGCVSHALPRAARLRRHFPEEELAVIGLHTVFEHHAVMTADALDAFLHEYRLPFPVGMDEPGDGPLPRTMQRYDMLGTPSLLLFDRLGRLRANHFGQVEDLSIGAEIGSLLTE